MLEGIRISRRGYPNRIPFAEFLHRYRILASSSSFSTDYGMFDARDAVQQICLAIGLHHERYQCGRTKLFCRIGVVSELEAMRRAKLERALSGLQAHIRWFLAQRERQCRQKEW